MIKKDLKILEAHMDAQLIFDFFKSINIGNNRCANDEACKKFGVFMALKIKNELPMYTGGLNPKYRHWSEVKTQIEKLKTQ